MIYLNGNFIKKSKKENMGFSYGYGCFETIMGLNEKCVFLDDHINRLKKSLKYLNIHRKINFKQIIEKLIKKSDLSQNDEFSLKIIITDRDIFFQIKKMGLRVKKEGVSLGKIHKFYQNELGFIKSTNYMTNILARKQLKKRNLFEGIFSNRLGYITEGTISNVFWIKDGVLLTPSLDLNILPGITRRKILDIAKKQKIPIKEGHFKYCDLKEADGIFITNSLMKNGLLWINLLEDIKFNKLKLINNIEKVYSKKVQNML
ncbi:MAG: aminotransferase class IV [Fusobacteriota bacterium]